MVAHGGSHFRCRFRPAARALAIVAGVYLIGWNVWVSAPLVGHREYAGAPADLAAFRARLEPNAVALYEWRSESFRIALPLQYWLGLTGYLVPPKGDGDPRLVDLVRWYQAEGRPVYWVSIGGERDALRRRFDVEPVAAIAWRWPEWEARGDRRPDRASALSVVADVFRLRPLGRERAEPPPLDSVDVGDPASDAAVLASGFGPPTRLAGCAVCRRAEPSAALWLPPPETVDPLELVLGLAGGRTATDPPARVRITLNGRQAGERTLSNDFRTYYFPLGSLPPGRPVEVGIKTLPDGWTGPGIGVDLVRLERTPTGADATPTRPRAPDR